jgi:uncharacterized protein YjbI with pentapeptide repeats
MSGVGAGGGDTGAHASVKAKVSHVILSDAKVSHVILSDAKVSHVILSDAKVSHVILSDAKDLFARPTDSSLRSERHIEFMAIP